MTDADAMTTFREEYDGYGNGTYYYYEYNATTLSPEQQAAYTEYMRLFEQYSLLLRDREIFQYVYHTLAAPIVFTNVLLIVAILASRKQRKHFRNWLTINIALIFILTGGIICPFLGQQQLEGNAGLDTVGCKILFFIADALNYMANVSIAILGVYHFLYMCSSRLMTGVSNVLLVAITIATPWVIVAMLTVVLRLTMSEEYKGECYKIFDKTTQILWIVLGYGFPLLITFLCLIGITVMACSPFTVRSVELAGTSRRHVTLFVSVCLLSCLLLQAPYYFIHSEVISDECELYHGYSMCKRLIIYLDQCRLFSMLLIPLVYLIPREVKKCFRKVRKILTKSVDCSSKTSCKTPSIELRERSLITTND